MELFRNISPAYYSAIYCCFIFILCLLSAMRYLSSAGTTLLYAKKEIPFLTFAVGLMLILFLGLRPLNVAFGDSGMYAHVYNNFSDHYSTVDWQEEWLWARLRSWCQLMGFSVNAYFLIIEALYIGLMFLCCWMLFPNNVWVSFLFCLASFSFYGYAVNGLRNGLACSIMLATFPLVTKTKLKFFIGFFLCVLAVGVHRSTLLPALALFMALFLIKEPKYAIWFWIASIFISLFVGNYVGDFFAGLGFDDRMTDYFQSQDDAKVMKQFSETGFRFDFLLYSAMPVLMTWYVTIKRNFEDRTFNIIAVTYILANAFWVMVIRAAYSNRFAYLSWFLYPIVIVYPLLRFRLWDDQDRKAALILLLYEGFTFTMFLLGQSR